MRVFVTLVFESSLCIHCSLSWWVHKYWVFWMLEFLCHFFLQWIICSCSDFHPAMPTQFCNLPYISIIYWKLHMSCLEIFSYILQLFVWNVWCCTVSNFYRACDISIIYCSGGGFLFVYYLSCWVATYAYSWINIYRGWTNNGNTGQCRNKTVCVGCTERTLIISFIILCMCVLCSASVNTLQTVFSNSLYGSTAECKTVRVSKRTDCWCAFSWHICNEMATWLGVSRTAVSKVKMS